ncbi:MAG TPA: 1,4-alpha-glucan branching protein GlgB [Steroidobacteraceae bacterium]|nr:1,4-alpha-glucan branching protein GlgB [Steroidobacteraceae bacterium]
MTPEQQKLADGRHHDPHSVLGPRRNADGQTALAHLPATRAAWIEQFEMQRIPGSDFFSAETPPGALPEHPRLHWITSDEHTRERIDPYSFAPTISAMDLESLNQGTQVSAWRFMGATPMEIDGIQGTRFAVWAPNAERVSVVGPFCDWDGRRCAMRVLGGSGVWELFIPGIGLNEIYKFEIRARNGAVFLKTDPYGRASESRPATASVVTAQGHPWLDHAWMQARRSHDWLHAPMSIYEVHLGSWRRHPDGRYYTYRELAEALIPYVKQLGFTHLELLPITEHPLDDSWGYQCTGYFCPTSRHGSPDDLRFFVDQCHLAGIGVLLDWVPGHFPRDGHGLARFDGTALYEYEDPRKAEHKDWGTLIFNYERHEVRSFLLSSACFWLEEFHFDGLRVDAVASMLYLDFGRGGDYVPNRYGGRENLEAIDFMRALNATTHLRSPGTVIMAEESTDWPMVSRPTDMGGLGFSMKWNMGWMHDTLSYFKQDPVYRSHHQNRITFAMMYAYSENFILPLSHDEVVHLKRSLLGRMPGDRWQQLANLRLLYAYMWTFPGKKLLFMGGEFGHPWEWDFRGELPWWLLQHAEHEGVRRAVADLNRLYANEPALYRHEFEPGGFNWVDCNDAAQSVLSYLRRGDGYDLLVVLNLTPVPRNGYRVGTSSAGRWRAVFNSDSSHYGGGNVGNPAVETEPRPIHDQPHSVVIDLPPLGAVVFKRD